MGIDYGFLFQGGDLIRRKSDQINYEYYEKNPKDTQELDEILGLEKKLFTI